MAAQIQLLVKQAKEGDKDAFGKLYKVFLPKIFRFIYSSTRDYDGAADLTQLTFLKVWRALPSYRAAKASFQTFLFAIARNLIIDASRKKKLLRLEAVEQKPSDENIEDDAQKKQERELLFRCLAKLDPKERHVVVLRYFEELSFRDIAHIVGKNEGAVRVMTHRVLKKLKINYLAAEQRGIP